MIPYREIEEADWDEAMALAWRLRSRGITVPWLDVLIASVAIAEDVRIYAIDAHFAQIAEAAPLRLYRPGYGGGYRGE